MEHKKEETIEIPVGKYLNAVRKNPWIASTFVLAIALVLVFIFGGLGGGSTVSADEAGQKVLTFLNSNPNLAGQVSYVSAERDGQLYEITIQYDGTNVPVYATLDGEFLVEKSVALGDSQPADTTDTDTTPTPTPTNVQKSDKPVVEVFVMSHCPYGTQIEKGILPVVDLLGDKIDFEVKFVDYAMHGEVEVKEQTRQYCIQEEQNAKYIDYLTCFLEDGNTESCLTEAGVDKNKMNTCMARIDTEFKITENWENKDLWLKNAQGQPSFPKFLTHATENEQYGVQGSPTLVINGAQASSQRDPASLLRTICAGFNTAPEECNTQLTATAPGPGFGWSSTGGATAADCIV